jgi:hypothetical protein
MNTQPLNDEQRVLLNFLLDREFPGRAELAAQALSVATAGRSCSCGCPSFSLVADLSLPPAVVDERMVSDAHGTDPGGNEVGVLLFTEDGYLSEVEVYSATGGGFDGLPRPDSLQLSNWSDPDEGGVRRLTNP